MTRLLREVKYMLRMKLPVNDMALSIYHQEKTFRSHISRYMGVKAKHTQNHRHNIREYL